MHDDYTKDRVDHEDNLRLTENSYYAYLNEISQYKVLSRDEELELFLRIQNGDDVARELFVNSNLRLVIKIARSYYKPGYNQLLDLIQDGNIGLLKAIDHYEPSKGCKFSTYAYFWIHKCIQRSSCRTGLPLELPQAKLALVNKIHLAINRLQTEHDQIPSEKMIADYLCLPVNQVSALMPFVIPSVSLNDKIQDDTGEREYIDVFSDYYSDCPSEIEYEYIIKETKEEFRDLLTCALTEKEFYIVSHRWGLFGFDVDSVRTIAEDLNMSEQAVRQSSDKSIIKLRKYLHSHDKSVEDFAW